MVKTGWRSTNRNCCSAGFPATGWGHRTPCIVTHRQVILCAEIRCISLVSNPAGRATVVGKGAVAGGRAVREGGETTSLERDIAADGTTFVDKCAIPAEEVSRNHVPAGRITGENLQRHRCW